VGAASKAHVGAVDRSFAAFQHAAPIGARYAPAGMTPKGYSANPNFAESSSANQSFDIKCLFMHALCSVAPLAELRPEIRTLM
jgi:hypothetical protein